jgi:hypothetical protein
MISGLVPIIIGGLGALVQRLRSEHHHGSRRLGGEIFHNERFFSCAQGDTVMLSGDNDLPATSRPAPHNWRSGTVALGLFCLVAGLFLAAGFKDAIVPKVLAIGGIVFLVVGGIASAVASRRQASNPN